MPEFELNSDFQPTGDQPEAIMQLVNGLENGQRLQTLLGATGTGKTYTIANVIERVQKPTLVIAHNKTLAAQLYSEFREFFPKNAISFFVSYYDYYQPEAYVPRHDLYIEKEVDQDKRQQEIRYGPAKEAHKHAYIIANRILMGGRVDADRDCYEIGKEQGEGGNRDRESNAVTDHPVDGLFVRDFENGWVVYNRSGSTQSISFEENVSALTNEKIATSHEVSNYDGDIFLKVVE